MTTATYLDALYGDREGVVAVVYDHRPAGGPWREQVYAWPPQRGQLSADAAENAAGANVHICPALRKVGATGRRKGEAGSCRALWADLDRGDPLENVVAALGALGPYALIVGSGSPGHWHVYLLLAQAIELAELYRLNQALAKRLGGDAKWSDESLLRLPGTPNHKPGAGLVAIQVEPEAGRRAPLELVRTELGGPAQPDTTTPSLVDRVRAAVTTPAKLTRDLQRRLDEEPNGDRSAQTWALVASAAEHGHDDDAIAALLEGHAPTQARRAEKGERWYADEVARQVDKARTTHPHPGQPCDRASCANRPRWMNGDEVKLPRQQHRTGGATTAGLGVTEADGAAILDQVYEFLGRFVAYPDEWAHRAHTLWIAHTHAMDAWDSTPRIAFLSPERGSGKTRALEVSELLVPRPVLSVNTTPAYLFRKVSDPDGRPTILYDEIDTIFGPKAKEHEDVRGMLNAGHRKNAVAGRCVVRGKVIETEELPAYCAVALAGLGTLPDTILSRSVVIRMRKRKPDEKVQPFRPRGVEAEGHALRDRLASWALLVQERLAETRPVMPDGIADRDADVWEALIAVADVAAECGPSVTGVGSGVTPVTTPVTATDWPGAARESAVTGVTASRQDEPSTGVLLLRDLHALFRGGQTVAIATSELLQNLRGLEESPWHSFDGFRRGEGLDANHLATLLQRYGVKPRLQRLNGKVTRGYWSADFADTWSRYLVTPVTPVTLPLSFDEPDQESERNNK